MDVQVVIATRGNPRFECVQMAEYFGKKSNPIKFIQSNGGAAHGKSLIVYWYMNYCKAGRLLILDDDVVPHPNLLSMVDRDVDIVGAPYPLFNPGISMMPFDCAYKFSNGGYYPIEDDGKLSGLVECDAVGSGALLIKRDVLEKIRPAFIEVFDGWGRRIVSEDIYFCQEARKLGYKIWADYNVKCDHIKAMAVGDMVYRVEVSTRMWDGMQVLSNGGKDGSK